MKKLFALIATVILALLGFHTAEVWGESHTHKLQRYSLSFGDYPGVHFYPNNKRKNNPTLVFTLAGLIELTADQKTVVREQRVFPNFHQKIHEHGDIMYETEGTVASRGDCAPIINLQMRNWKKEMQEEHDADMHTSFLEYRLTVKNWCPEQSDNVLQMVGVLYSSNGAKVRVGNDMIVSKLDPKHYVQFKFKKPTGATKGDIEQGENTNGITFPYITSTRVEFATTAAMDSSITWSGMVVLSEAQPRSAIAARAFQIEGRNFSQPSSDRTKDKSSKNDVIDKSDKNGDASSESSMQTGEGDDKNKDSSKDKDKNGKKPTKPGKQPLFDDDDDDENNEKNDEKGKEDDEEDAHRQKDDDEKDNSTTDHGKNYNGEKDAPKHTDGDSSNRGNDNDSDSQLSEDANSAATFASVSLIITTLLAVGIVFEKLSCIL